MNDACRSLPTTSFIVRLMHLVHRIEHAANRCFFEPHGLSMSTGQILMCLFHADGKTPTELTQMLGSKKSNMTQRIAALKKAGLVNLTDPNQGDRRSVRVSLTEQGKTIATAMNEVFSKHIQDLEHDISSEQRQHMIYVLDRMNEKLDSVECLHH